jgi:hypothetical protein
MQGHIYKLYDDNNEFLYIGSTMKTMYNELKNIKECKSKFRTFNPMFKKYGKDNINIEILETFIFEDEEELIKKEAEYIMKMDCDNKKIDGLLFDDWIEQNKQAIEEYKIALYKRIYDNYRKKYYLKNKNAKQYKKSRNIKSTI